MAAPSPAEIEGRLVHEVPKPVGFQRILANQDLTEPSRPQVQGGGFDDGLHDQGAAVNFAVADDTGVGRNSDNERVLRGESVHPWTSGSWRCTAWTSVIVRSATKPEDNRLSLSRQGPSRLRCLPRLQLALCNPPLCSLGRYQREQALGVTDYVLLQDAVDFRRIAPPQCLKEFAVLSRDLG